ncbi:MAG: lipid asymmetry maintenance protein MlaB, partial [Rickettsiales bacterium]
ADSICLDASGVSRLTSPALQVLCAFVKECEKKAKRLYLYNPSTVFKAEISSYGLERDFFDNPNVQVENG